MPRGLRIAWFVPPSQHFAGIERVVHEIATGVARVYGDIDVHVVFASRYDEPLLSDTAYTTHVLDIHRLRAMAGALRRCVRDHGIDVLVTPQVEASVIAWLATRGPGAPLVVPHLHGNPRLEEADGTRRTRAAFRVFRALVAPRVPGVLAVSPALRDHAAHGVAARSRVVYVPNPVRELSTRTAEPSPDDAFRFVCVGRLSYQKGQDVLLRAFAVARPDLPAVRLTLVGSGPQEARLRELCTESGLDDIVEFAGYATDPAVHLRSADCLVLASRWEGFGVVLAEALQFGLPLLATDCEFGPADVIVDDRIGYLVAPDDPAALAHGLRRAVIRTSDAADRAHRQAAAAPFRPGAAVAAHVAALRRMVADRTGHRARRVAPIGG